MRITGDLTDAAVLGELGARIRRTRLARGEMTQAQLATEAGLSVPTVKRIEAGESTQTTTLIRVLRELGLLGGVEGLVPEPGPSPMELLERRGQPRKRVRHPRSESGRDPGRSPWRWGDDKP